MASHMIINTRDKIIAPLSVEMEISKVCDFFWGGIDVLLWELNFVADDGIIIESDGLIVSKFVGVTVSGSNTSIVSTVSINKSDYKL